jgi:hypothetical protein
VTQCEECIARRRHVEESCALLRDKRWKYRNQPEHTWGRLLGDYVHQARQAIENLAAHELECRGRQL